MRETRAKKGDLVLIEQRHNWTSLHHESGASVDYRLAIVQRVNRACEVQTARAIVTGAHIDCTKLTRYTLPDWFNTKDGQIKVLAALQSQRINMDAFMRETFDTLAEAKAFLGQFEAEARTNG